MILPVSVFSQFRDNNILSVKNIVVTNQLIIKDTFTIIPYSLQILDKNDQTIPDSFYIINNNEIRLTDFGFMSFKGDSLKLFYRTLLVNLGKHYFHLDSNALKNTERAVYIGYDMGKKLINPTYTLPNSLDYDGSFSRGISLGNKQDLSLNSNFNIQMAGDIGGGINLKAAISDANIPFQPEGTTQSLNEFDKVFIEIQKDKHSLIAGDFEITNPQGYFTRYFKKLKGLNYANEIKIDKRYTSNNRFNVAISKGKFNRINLKAVNGNQGPYKLYGNSGEKYLIVLAGTEKVFLDGRLLKRGYDNDYIIDYNLAEIIFTPEIMITENSRLTVEFEYSEQNYLRSLITLNTVTGDSVKNIYLNFYSEQDSKSTTGLIELDSTDIQTLESAGDDPNNIYKSGIKKYVSTDDLNEKIFYRKIYMPMVQDSVLLYTGNPDSAQYIAYFTDFGENKGSYQIDNSVLANGRIYKWVGKGNGRYEPLIQLVAPEKKQLLSIGANYHISENTLLRSEFSLSNLDKNRFSASENDNVGYAGFVELKSKKLFKILNNKLEISNSGMYEFSDKNYKSLNPYRATEFSRDWNLIQALIPSHEHLVTNALAITLSGLNINYTYSGFFRPDFFTGNRNELLISYNYRGFSVSATGNMMKSSDQIFKTGFFRPKISISQKIPFLKDTKIGLNYENENNTIRTLTADSLQKSSFAFDQYRIYINFRNSSKSSMDLYTGYRKDFLPVSNKFSEFTHAKEIGVSGEFNHKNISNINYNLVFRQLSLIDKTIGLKRPESNLLGKVNHNLKLFNNGISSVTIMEFGSGQQAKADFVFIKVAPGTGTHIWNDGNKDGIEGKDEFLIIPGIDTANYVKYIQYNNEYIRANTSSFNNNFRIELKKLFKTKGKKLYSILSGISFNSIFRVTEKTISSEQTFAVPFFNQLADTSVLLNNLSYVGTLYYNLGDPKYDFHLGYKKNKDLVSQVGGFTKNKLREYFTYFRINLIRGIEYYNTFSIGKKEYESQLNILNNFSFDFFSSGHELQLYPSKTFNIKLNYNFSRKANDSEMKETALIHDLKLSGKLIKWKNSKIENSVSYIRIKYDGSGNSYIELTMLEGLKNGNNFLWSMRFTKRLKNNLDIILQYDGRKTSTSSPLHSAKMQARATF